MNPAIVIMAYDRPESLQRLLNSLAKAQYPVDQNTPLVISVDRSDNAKVPKMVQNFDWPHGTKKVIHHEERLGIVGNFLFCGGLSEEFGSIIFLEDDFYVSPTFYDYARQALSFYESLDRVAIQSLYALKYNGFTHQPFTPILDSADVFFTQVGWFRGMAVSASQWRRFTGWLENKPATPNSQIPEQWQQLGDDEWHPLLSSYLVDTDQYFVYPRSSVVTDFSDAGMHFDRRHQPLPGEFIAGVESIQLLNPGRIDCGLRCFSRITAEKDKRQKSRTAILRLFNGLECQQATASNKQRIRYNYKAYQ